MDLDQLLAHHRAKAKQPDCPIRKLAYRKHYPLVKAAVKKGVPLRAVVMILQEKEGAFDAGDDFATKGWQAPYYAYLRALKKDGVKIEPNTD